LGRGRRNQRRYLSRDHGGHVRGQDQLGGAGGFLRLSRSEAVRLKTSLSGGTLFAILALEFETLRTQQF
jgi:hypothetical protein